MNGYIKIEAKPIDDQHSGIYIDRQIDQISIVEQIELLDAFCTSLQIPDAMLLWYALQGRKFLKNAQAVCWVNSSELIKQSQKLSDEEENE